MSFLDVACGEERREGGLPGGVSGPSGLQGSPASPTMPAWRWAPISVSGCEKQSLLANGIMLDYNSAHSPLGPQPTLGWWRGLGDRGGGVGGGGA